MSCFQIKSKKYDLENTSHAKMCVSRIFYTQDDVQTISNKVKISNSLTTRNTDYRKASQQIVLTFNNGSSIQFFAEDRIGQIFNGVKTIKFGVSSPSYDQHQLRFIFKLDGDQSNKYGCSTYQFPNDSIEHILEITQVDYNN